jgi:hypothetical protein
MTPLFKNLVIALIITLLLSAAYLIFGRSSDVGDVTLGGGMNPALMMRSQEILNNTSKIDGYTLDTEVLSDRRFTSLTSTRVDLNALDIQAGRANPFAPVR